MNTNGRFVVLLAASFVAGLCGISRGGPPPDHRWVGADGNCSWEEDDNWEDRDDPENDPWVMLDADDVCDSGDNGTCDDVTTFLCEDGLFDGLSCSVDADCECTSSPHSDFLVCLVKDSGGTVPYDRITVNATSAGSMTLRKNGNEGVTVDDLELFGEQAGYDAILDIDDAGMTAGVVWLCGDTEVDIASGETLTATVGMQVGCILKDIDTVSVFSGAGTFYTASGLILIDAGHGSFPSNWEADATLDVNAGTIDIDDLWIYGYKNGARLAEAKLDFDGDTFADLDTLKMQGLATLESAQHITVTGTFTVNTGDSDTEATIAMGPSKLLTLTGATTIQAASGEECKVTLSTGKLVLNNDLTITGYSASDFAELEVGLFATLDPKAIDLNAHSMLDLDSNVTARGKLTIKSSDADIEVASGKKLTLPTLEIDGGGSAVVAAPTFGGGTIYVE